jgi:hypothetical protein
MNEAERILAKICPAVVNHDNTLAHHQPAKRTAKLLIITELDLSDRFRHGGTASGFVVISHKST